jgi:hypothetical protein
MTTLAIATRTIAEAGVLRARADIDEVARLSLQGRADEEQVLVAVNRLGVALSVLERMPRAPKRSARPVRAVRTAQYQGERLPHGTVEITLGGRHLRAVLQASPRELAAVLLTSVLGPETVRDLSFDFAAEHAWLAHDQWTVTADHIRAWAAKHD